jgi:hypothetical protein
LLQRAGNGAEVVADAKLEALQFCSRRWIVMDMDTNALLDGSHSCLHLPGLLHSKGHFFVCLVLNVSLNARHLGCANVCKS